MCCSCSRSFNQKYNINIELKDWKDLLNIYLDRTPRSNESIYLEMNSNPQRSNTHLHCDIFNCSERFGLQRPPHRNARIPLVNDSCNNISLIPLLLAKIIAPDSSNLLDIIKQYRIENYSWKHKQYNRSSNRNIGWYCK